MTNYCGDNDPRGLDEESILTVLCMILVVRFVLFPIGRELLINTQECFMLHIESP